MICCRVSEPRGDLGTKQAGVKVSPLMGIIVLVTHEYGAGAISPEGGGSLCRSVTEAKAGGENGLTAQVGPGGDAADGVSRVAAQAIVQQLAVSQPEAQQDPVDLLLGRGLRGGEGRRKVYTCVTHFSAAERSTSCESQGLIWKRDWNIKDK